MTERDFDRIATAWLDLMPSEAPDRAIDAVFETVERTRQVRRLGFRLPWRPQMNRLTILAATVAVLVAAIAGAMLLTAGRDKAVPTAPPTPSTGATPAPTIELPTAFDESLWGSWVADAEPIPGLPDQGDRIQATFSWDGGSEFVVQTDYVLGYQALRSESIGSTPGQVRLRTLADIDGCQRGDLGTYAWTRSSNGLFLTMDLVEDDCDMRATTVARTWVRTLGAVSDGGTALALLVDPNPDMLVTLPRVTFGMAATPPVDIGTFRDGEPDLHLLIYRNPEGFDRGCDLTDRGQHAIEPTPEALRAYIESLPMTNVATTPVTIGGLPGVHITAESTPGSCAAGDLALFNQPATPTDNGGPGEIAFTLGDPLSLWAVQVGADMLVIAYTGADVTPAAEQAVIDSIQFPGALPTP